MGVWTPGPGATPGDDLYQGDAAADVANGLGGDDTLFGGDGDDFLTGGGGNDILYTGAALEGGVEQSGLDTLDGGAGNDLLIDHNRFNRATLDGGKGNDEIRAYLNDSVDGGAGNDRIVLGYTNQPAGSLQGGGGTDTLVLLERDSGHSTDVKVSGFSAANGFEFIEGPESVRFTGDASANLLDFSEVTILAAALKLDGNQGDDTLIGGNAGDALSGDDGMDLLQGGYGADTLHGGVGSDQVDGEGGDDHIICQDNNEQDRAFGGNGDDIFESDWRDIMNGGAGLDYALIDARSFSGDLTLDVGASSSGAFQDIGDGSIVHFERIRLLLSGAGGDDFISGYHYADEVYAGGGNDSLTGAGGADRLYGETGEDLLAGGAGDDLLTGGGGRDTLLGSQDDDLLNGGNGADFLDGGTGADTLAGSAGDDTLTGGAGDDSMTGGADSDLFFFRNADVSAPGGIDTIDEFTPGGVDTIDLSGIDANTGSGGNQAFAFIGDAEFSGQAGQLKVFPGEGNFNQVEGDVNGDGEADFTILVDSATELTAGDFVL